jgi:cytochrome P450
MAMHPEVQEAAQAEVDRVVGSDRLPTFEDRKNMPYIEALIKESLRWHVVAPTGVPHMLIEDDIHNGYLIPKGSLIIPNQWYMSRNPSVYPNPEKFDPTRFIASPGKEVQPDSVDFCFGFGRRICPGRLLADNSVFLAIVSILATFNISRVIENGVPDTLFPDQIKGTISHQKPYRCNISPRSEKAAVLVQESH